MAKNNVNPLPPSPELIERHKSGTNLRPATNSQSAQHYSFEAVETASLGKCCVDDTLLYWDALEELTSSANGLNEKALRKRLDAITGLVTVGQRFAIDMSSLLEAVHHNHKAAHNDLLSAKVGA